MRNQTSFRLTTTLLPTDTTAKTTTVINKLDASGNKFYPTFTEETVVLTNDDRTVMETTRATCNNWVLTFVKRWLSDDNSETQVANRKLTRNPWSLCFITAWAWDWIDKDDSITWTGNQTYTGNLTSTWNATYNWLLTTNKWVKYPSFENVAALEAYNAPFWWMFATVDSTWELYRYNAVTEEWSVVTTATPSNPEMAWTSTIWTVRIATNTEFNNGTATWGSGEYLVPTITKIKSVKALVWSIEDSEWHQIKLTLTDKDQDLSTTFTVPFDWFFVLKWQQERIKGRAINYASASGTWVFKVAVPDYHNFYQSNGSSFNTDIYWIVEHRDVYFAEKDSIVSLSFGSVDDSWTAWTYWWSDVETNSKKLVVITDWFYIWY